MIDSTKIPNSIFDREMIMKLIGSFEGWNRYWDMREVENPRRKQRFQDFLPVKYLVHQKNYEKSFVK